MKTTNYNPAEHEKFLKQTEPRKIIELGGKHYIQVDEIQMRAGNQYICVLDVEDENVILKDGMALIEIPDEGSRMGVLVIENNRARITAITPADVAVTVTGNWNRETTSDWIESQFDR